MPGLSTQKAALTSKEVFSLENQFKFEGTRQNASRSKENRPTVNKSMPFSKKQNENCTTEIGGVKTSLRSVLGQVFSNNQVPPSCNLNLKEVTKQPEYKVNGPNDENSRGMVEFILDLYKRGAEKAAGKSKASDPNPITNGWKLTEHSKQTANLQAKARQIITNDSFNQSIFGEEKGGRSRELGPRLSNKSQGKNEVLFRLRKLKLQ